MVKPFEPEELVAQVEASLKHSASEQLQANGDNEGQNPGSLRCTLDQS